MNLYFTITCVVIGVLTGVFSWLYVKTQKRLDRHKRMLVSLAEKMAGMKEEMSRLDESNGLEIHRLQTIIDGFMSEYGEAAIEAEKETARAEKAWADGVNNIMRYGPGLHGRGDST